MVKISPTTPVRPLTDQRREFNPAPRNPASTPPQGELLDELLEGEVEEAAVLPAPRRHYERRRGRDRRQRTPAKPYLDVRCTQDRRQKHLSSIDIKV